MTLLRVLDYGDERDQGNIVWSYYPNIDLMAYSVGRKGKGHPQIEIAVEDRLGEEIGDANPTGEIVPPLRKIGAVVQVAGYRTDVNNNFYKLIKMILENEGIPIENPPAQVVFSGRTFNLKDLLE